MVSLWFTFRAKLGIPSDSKNWPSKRFFCYDSKRKTSNSIDGFKPNLSHFSFWKSLHKKHVFRTFWGLSGGKRSKFYKRLCTRVSLQNAGRAGQVHSDHPPAFLGLLLHYLAGHRSFLPVIMGLFANKEAPFLDLLGVTIPSDHCCWSSHHRVSTPNSPAHTVDWHSGSCRALPAFSSPLAPWCPSPRVVVSSSAFASVVTVFVSEVLTPEVMIVALVLLGFLLSLKGLSVVNLRRVFSSEPWWAARWGLRLSVPPLLRGFCSVVASALRALPVVPDRTVVWTVPEVGFYFRLLVVSCNPLGLLFYLCLVSFLFRALLNLSLVSSGWCPGSFLFILLVLLTAWPPPWWCLFSWPWSLLGALSLFPLLLLRGNPRSPPAMGAGALGCSSEAW